jgi:hypothetical protein
MKATTLLLLTLPITLLAQNTQPDMQWVDDEIAAIKPPRKGVPSSALRGLKDPFRDQLILNQPPVEESGETPAQLPSEPEEQNNLTLQAIVNGNSALIDGKWYKEDEKIYGYLIQKIDRDSVLLQQKKKKLKLSLIVKNDNIKINAK